MEGYYVSNAGDLENEVVRLRTKNYDLRETIDRLEQENRRIRSVAKSAWEAASVAASAAAVAQGNLEWALLTAPAAADEARRVDVETRADRRGGAFGVGDEWAPFMPRVIGHREEQQAASADNERGNGGGGGALGADVGIEAAGEASVPSGGGAAAATSSRPCPVQENVSIYLATRGIGRGTPLSNKGGGRGRPF